MKNDNFVLQSSLEGNYLNIKLQEPVRLDEIAVRVVKQDCPEFLIPFHIVNINDSLSLKYKLINAVALEYSDMTLRKDGFVRLFRNLLEPFVKGNDWFLDYHNFCIDPRYVFLDRQKDGVHYIYIPESSYRNSDEEILNFFHDTFIHMTITDDANFQVRLFQYFSRRDVTLSDLYRLIQEEAKKLGVGIAPASVQPVPPAAVAGAAGVSGGTLGAQASGVGSGKPIAASGYAKPVGGAQSKRTESETPVSNPAKPAGGLFGGMDNGKKNDGIRDDGDTDEVMQALFGDKKKAKDKGKTKENAKAKESAQAKESASAADGQAQKKAGGFSLFGRKKEQSAPAPAPAKAPQSVFPGNVSGSTSGSAVDFSAGASSGLFGGTAYSPMSGEGDKTEIISDDFQAAAYLELIESPIPGAPQRIELVFSAAFITVGRISSDEVQPDVAFGRDFTRIGRRHARIERKGGEYFVVDLGSANHTLLNGQILVPNQPYRLLDGGELTFTDSKPVRYRIHL